MSSTHDRREIIERNKTDYNFFANVCLPDVITYPFPAFYENLFLLLVKKLLELGGEEVILRLALSLPRGHAKTTFIKIFVVYGIIHDLFSFILVICANEDRARDFIGDVHEILKSYNISAIYDSWGLGLLEDNKDTKRGNFLKRRIVIQAAGAGTAFRGIVKDNMRPDFILFDDAQSEKNAESELESKRLLKWVTGTAIKTRNPKKCLVVWIGNMYDPPENCILYHLSNSASWFSLITGGILSNGQALWPELHSVKALLEEYRHDVSLGQGPTWFAEIQNDPLASPNRLLPDGNFAITIPSIDMEPIGGFITIDPAGRKKKSDDNVIAVHHVFEGGKTAIVGLVAEIMTPKQVIEKAIELALEHKITRIFPESNAYQETLVFWMEQALIELELYNEIQVIPIISSSSKLSRIKAFIKQLLSGEVMVFDPNIKASILFQALAFDVLKSDNTDDILDCGAMGEVVRNKYLHQCLFSPDGRLIDAPPKRRPALITVNPMTRIQSNRYQR